MSSSGCILFVEDDAPVLKTMRRYFTKQGFETYGAENAREEALSLAKTKLPDLAILDVMLHESGGGIGEVGRFLNYAEVSAKKVFEKPSYLCNCPLFRRRQDPWF